MGRDSSYFRRHGFLDSLTGACEVEALRAKIKLLEDRLQAMQQLKED
jgi:hypothetical protein